MRLKAFAGSSAAVLSVCIAPLAWAQQEPAGESVVVSGSITERNILEAAHAISVVGRQDIRQAGPMINASEALQRLPGIVANNRSNFAQDLQISSRGFGARAGFRGAWPAHRGRRHSRQRA